MAQNIQSLNVNAGEKQYTLTIPEKIYDELGLSAERFAELLARDFYCPTLTAAPTNTTLTYTDTDGSVNHFQIGQPCRWMEGSVYKIAILLNKTDSVASWYTFPDDMTSLLATKQDKNLYFTNLSASSWVSDSTYSDYPYRCDIACSGVSDAMYAEVIFGVAEANSGNYAPVCETKNGAVAIWSKTEAGITVQSIKISKR